MDEWLSALTGTPQGQFLLGVTVLVFGSRAILSEENLKGKLWGIGRVARWWKNRQETAAENELSELRRLRSTVARQHEYIVWITGVLRVIQIWAAENGLELPKPPFQTYNEWDKEREEEGE